MYCICTQKLLSLFFYKIPWNYHRYLLWGRLFNQWRASWSRLWVVQRHFMMLAVRNGAQGVYRYIADFRKFGLKKFEKKISWNRTKIACKKRFKSLKCSPLRYIWNKRFSDIIDTVVFCWKANWIWSCGTESKYGLFLLRLWDRDRQIARACFWTKHFEYVLTQHGIELR